MAKKSEKGASKPSKARTWERADIFRSTPQGQIDRDRGAESTDRRAGIKNRLRRSQAIDATWMLPRINILREILGEPPNSIRDVEAALLSKFNAEVADGKPLKLEDQQALFTEGDVKKILRIASIGELERARCFNDLFVVKNPSRNLEHLFSDYENLLYDREVTSEPRNIKSRENVLREFRSKSERPRWAEENRTGVRLQMRLSEKLLDEIDADAREAGMTRTDWIIDAVESYISNYGRKEPLDSPEFKSTKPTGIRISEELNDKISSESERHGLTKTEFVRRIARRKLAEPGSHLAPHADH